MECLTGTLFLQVQIETQPLAAQVLDPVGQSLTMTSISSQAPIISIAVDPTSPNAQTPILGAKRSHPDANPWVVSFCGYFMNSRC